MLYLLLKYSLLFAITSVVSWFLGGMYTKRKYKDVTDSFIQLTKISDTVAEQLNDERWDSRFDTQAQSLIDVSNQQQKNLDARFANLEEKLSNLQQNIEDKHKKQQQGQMGLLEPINTQFTMLKGALEDISQKAQSPQIDFNPINHKLDELQTHVSEQGYDKEWNDLSAKIAHLDESVKGFNIDFNPLKNALASGLKEQAEQKPSPAFLNSQKALFSEILNQQNDQQREIWSTEFALMKEQDNDASNKFDELLNAVREQAKCIEACQNKIGELQKQQQNSDSLLTQRTLITRLNDCKKAIEDSQLTANVDVNQSDSTQPMQLIASEFNEKLSQSLLGTNNKVDQLKSVIENQFAQYSEQLREAASKPVIETSSAQSANQTDSAEHNLSEALVVTQTKMDNMQQAIDQQLSTLFEEVQHSAQQIEKQTENLQAAAPAAPSFTLNLNPLQQRISKLENGISDLITSLSSNNPSTMQGLMPSASIDMSSLASKASMQHLQQRIDDLYDLIDGQLLAKQNERERITIGEFDDLQFVSDDNNVEASAIELEPLFLKSAQYGPADDLKRISGVGKVMEKILHQQGVYYFWQISGWTQQDIDKVDERLDVFKGRIERDSWVEQARRLALEPNSAKKPIA